MELNGIKALVTGTSRGIGAALEVALRAEGCEVTGVSRTGADPCDIGDPEQVAALFRRTGPVDLMINNAGVIHEPAALVDLPLAEWHRLFATNVFGTVAMLQAYLPAMNARGAGTVLNVSSTWGRHGAGRQSPYCATKFAVEGLSQAVAQEVARGVAVLAVNPGVVATEMLATCFEADVSGYTPPADCAASFVRMLHRLDGSWNGRSIDVADF
ncbi:MAG: SDR family NAD(P)-dependent oxidoreductase [Planctomycetota bacterium]|jgi:NAD(P)-dependent dehydrogenase (short-subunit alcohol dehydrogenase family)